MKYLSSTEFKQLATKALPRGIAVRKFYDSTAEQMPDRCVKFTISSDAVDRQSDRVMQDGWMLDNYVRNPVVLFGHDDSQPPVGKCVSIGIEDGRLKAVVEFLPESVPVYGPRAEAIYQMCCLGFMSATSVGFRPIEFELTRDAARGANDFEPGCDFIKAELVEFSIVSVPCNPEALIEATPQVSVEEAAPVGVETRSLNSPVYSRQKLQHDWLSL